MLEPVSPHRPPTGLEHWGGARPPPPLRRRHRGRRRRRAASGHRGGGQVPGGGAVQAAPHPLPHRRSPGRDVRGAGQRGGGLGRMAHLRHDQRRRLPRRPDGGAHHVRRGRRRRHRAGALRPSVQPHARRSHRPAPLRRSHPQPRRSPGAPGLLLGRPYRAHDPPDALPTVRQARRHLLRRVHGPRRRPGRRSGGGRRRLRAGHRRPPRLRHQGSAVRHRRLRQDVQGHLQRPRPHRRRTRPALPKRHPAPGHGVLSVPPHRHLQAGHPVVGGGPGRGRDPAQRRR